MDASRGSSRASRRTNDSLPVFNLPPPGMTKDSKAQHILGLSRTELHSARNESLKSKFKFRSVTQDNRPLDRPSDRALSNSTIDESALYLLEDRPETAIPDDSFGKETPVYRYPSNSTLRSFYDAVKTPLRISQQPSNSSSLDFILQNSDKTQPISQSQEMDTHHQSRFFRTTKSRTSSESNKLRKKSSDANFSSFSRRSSLSSTATKSPLITKVSVVSKPSTPTSRQSNRIRVIGSGEQQKSNTILDNRTVDDNKENPAFHTPYAKVHVRRPKAGTTHWFDDLEGISSDDDDDDEVVDEIVTPTLESEYVEHSFETALVQYDSLSKDHARLVNAQEIPRRRANEILESVILTMEPDWKETGRTNGDIQHSKRSSVDTKSTYNPLEEADLKEESILNLSVSEDEHEDDSDDDLPLSQSIRSLSGIRESIVVDNYDVFDVEIGLAHTVKATGKPSANRPLPIRLIHTKDLGRSLSPMSPSAFELESETIPHGEFDAKDPEEDILISSFPATPVDPYMHRRSSTRSSNSLSDNPSIASTRMMKVTRQEENLIAAMRMKRAAMKRAERMAARKASPRSIPSDSVPSDRPSSRRHNPPPSSFKIDQSILPTRRSSLSYIGDDISKEGIRPGTISITDSRITSDSETPLLSRFPGGIPYRSGSTSPDNTSPIFDITRSIQQFPRQPATYAVSPSNKSGKNDSHIIVLDNLNSALPSPMLPSQLFIESPFLAWERSTDSAAVH